MNILKMNIVKMTCAVIVAFTFSLPAFAETPITDAVASAYFENCVQGVQKDGTMAPDTQKKYCACTALNMKKSMSQEDIVALSKNERAALNKVLIHVNGPCMQYPVHDLINNKCMTSLKNAAICSCLAQKVGDYTKQETQKKLPKLLADNPDLYDTMSPIIDSPEFQQAQQQMALSCATNPTQK